MLARRAADGLTGWVAGAAGLATDTPSLVGG